MDVFGNSCFSRWQSKQLVDELSPVDNPPVLTSVKAGSAIPVKFSLGSDYGLDIFAPGSPGSQTISCSTGAGIDPVEEILSAGSSSLSYDSATGVYTYVWKTNKVWGNTCRKLIVTLDDGTVHEA